MARLFPPDRLPHWRSTRDTRDRLDLVTDQSVGARQVRADRIVYHPGDTSAPHYHTGCSHFFYILSGRGLLHLGGETHRLSAGMAVLVGPGEVHWFENDTDQEFAFLEMWVPPPRETVWVDPNDR